MLQNIRIFSPGSYYKLLTGEWSCLLKAKFHYTIQLANMVRDISTCRDIANLVADGFGACLRSARELDSVMEVGQQVPLVAGLEVTCLRARHLPQLELKRP